MSKIEELNNCLKEISLDNNSTINSALEIAQRGHKDQLRDNGGSYLEEHIYPIALSIINRYKDSDNIVTLVSCALLHDVLEDSDIPESEIRKIMGDEITDIVKMLTKSPKENSEEMSQSQKMDMNSLYLNRVINSNQETIILKLEDRLQNLSCITNESHLLKPEKYKRYIVETENLFIPLTKKINNHIPYEKLLKKETERIKDLFDIE